MRKAGFAAALVGASMLAATASAAPGAFERAVFDQLNHFRADPAGYAGELESYRPRFDGRLLISGGGDEIDIMTNEGVAAVDEAIDDLEGQKPLQRLQWSDLLARAAADHVAAQSRSGAVGHYTNGRGPGERIAALDRTALADFSAENVATISRPDGRIGANFAVKRLHRNLMDSPSHRENILHPKATHVAFGVVRTESGVWVTQLFMRVSGTLPRAAPLRVSAAQALEGQPAGLEGWRFVRYDMVAPSGAPEPPAGGLRAGRDARLAAYATQPGDDPLSYYWMRFPGPAVTITP